MGGNRIDQLRERRRRRDHRPGRTGKVMHRLQACPQFDGLQIPPLNSFPVLIQGFGQQVLMLPALSQWLLRHA
jgi:hypothetical protein